MDNFILQSQLIDNKLDKTKEYLSQSLNYAKINDWQNSHECFQKADFYLGCASYLHFKTFLQIEHSISLYTIYIEDRLMCIKTYKTMIQELIELYKLHDL